MVALTHLSPQEHPRAAVIASALLAVVAVTVPVAMFFADEPSLRWAAVAAVAGLAAIAIADLRWEGGDMIRLLGFTGAVLAIPAGLLPFLPDDEVSATRLAGDDRVTTALAVSRHVHDAADAAVVVEPTAAVDAMAAGPLAAHLGVPLLFTGPGLRGEMERLGVDTAYLVGSSAFGTTGERLQRDGVDRVVRLAGEDAAATTAAVIERIEPSRVYVTAGWVDGVAVTPQLGAGVALLTVGGGQVPAATLDALREAAPEELVVVGGEAAMPGAVADQLAAAAPDARFSRVVGADRWSTSLALVEAPDVDPGPVWLASGDSWPDALVAGLGAAAQDQQLVLVPGDRATAVMSATVQWLERHDDELGEVTVVGGGGAVPADLLGRFTG